jgi:hypothetical protein
VARLGCAHGGLERLVVAHLADERDVGVLADQRAQRVVEVDAVDADLALVDGCLVVLEDVLDRVLDRDDVHLLALVDVLQHRGDGRRLAGAGDAREEDEPLRREGHVAQGGRQVQVLELLDVARDESGRDRRLAARHEDIHAEAVLLVVVVCEVHRPLLAEDVELTLVEHVLRDLEHQVLRDHVDLDVLQDAAVADARLEVALDDEVAAAELDDGAQPEGPGLHPLAGRGAAAGEVDRARKKLLSVMSRHGRRPPQGMAPRLRSAPRRGDRKS